VLPTECRRAKAPVARPGHRRRCAASGTTPALGERRGRLGEHRQVGVQGHPLAVRSASSGGAWSEGRACRGVGRGRATL